MIFSGCASRNGTTCYNDEWDRWRLLELAPRKLKEAIANDRYGIKKIALLSIVSNSFDPTGYWASARQRAWRGTFHPIRFRTLRLSAVSFNLLGNGEDSVSATVKVDAEDHAILPLAVKLESDQKSKDKLLWRIDAYFLSHLYKFITAVSIGDQNQSVTSVELVTGQKTSSVSKQGECARAALVLGLRAAGGIGVKTEFSKAEIKTVRSLDQADAWLEITTRTFCLKNCLVNVGREANFVLSQDEGVFHVSLTGVREDDAELDHVIVVDAGKSDVWDFVEEYRLNMDPSVIDHCVSDDARFCAFNELKRLDVQPVRKWDQKQRKMYR